MCVYPSFCFCDLDLDPMTLKYEFYLDVIEKCLHTKNEVSRSKLSKVRARTGQTNKQMRPNAFHSQGGKNQTNLPNKPQWLDV